MSVAGRVTPIRAGMKNRARFCSVRRRGRSTRRDLRRFACRPAVALMFIDDSHGLHERIANGRSDETETSPFEILAHRVAREGRWSNPAQLWRPAAQRRAARERPDMSITGSWPRQDLQVRFHA